MTKRMPDDEYQDDPDQDPGVDMPEDQDHDLDDDIDAVVDAAADLAEDGIDLSEPDPAEQGDVTEDDDVDMGDPVSKGRRWVALESLVLEYKFWANPRTQTGLDDEALARLEQSILAQTANVATEDDAETIRVGVETPIDVVQIQGADGETINLVIDGQRRTMAARRSLPGDALMPVQDLEPTPVVWTSALAAKYLSRALDGVATREGLSGPELAEAAARLRGATDADTGKPITIAAIARTLGRSEAWVSKALSAMDAATVSLKQAWKAGEITDEQFQIIAGSGAATKQRSLLNEAKTARESGDKSSARTLIREERERQRQEKAIAAPKGGKQATSAKESQTSIPAAPPRGRMPNQVVDDIIAMATTNPPTHDLCKGIVLGIKAAAGVIDTADLPDQWRAWLDRCAGSSQGKGKARGTKKAPKKTPKKISPKKTAEK